MTFSTTRRGALQSGFAFAAASLLALPRPGMAQAPNPDGRPMRLRGTLTAVSSDQIELRLRSGESVSLALSPKLSVTEIYPISFADIHPGSFVGVGATRERDGSQRAIAVMVFPEALRGTGEGHRPFDFLPQATMTNATVAGFSALADGRPATEGRQLRLTYKDGEQSIVVPQDAPVVSLRPGTRELLVAGATVTLTAQPVDGKPTALRISAGRNGFAPPY